MNRKLVDINYLEQQVNQDLFGGKMDNKEGAGLQSVPLQGLTDNMQKYQEQKRQRFLEFDHMHLDLMNKLTVQASKFEVYIDVI